MMTAVDAAYKVLQEAGKPLHYLEIAIRVLKSDLWPTNGKTPENTINRDINAEIVHRGKLARFVRLGDGIYAAVSQAGLKEPKTLPPDLAFVADTWNLLPIAARQKVRHIVRAAMKDLTDEVDDPVIASVLPSGPKAFPKDFLNGDIVPIRTVRLPEEELTVRQLTDGRYVVESHFGFCLDVRNETEGMFIVYAHTKGALTLGVPKEMIHLFKAVKGYEGYLRTVWQDLYRAYGHECGDPTAAYNHAKTAFETLGLPAPAERPPPINTEKESPGDRKPKQKRGTRTPETAFYVPILQALDKLGGSGKTAEVIAEVGKIMGGALAPEDREPLPSTGMPRWDNTSRFARHSMVRNGLLKSDSSWGVWEISEGGREYLRQRRNG